MKENKQEFEYQLLDRLRMDCDYYLGNGGHYAKHLWAGNEEEQIAKMREIYNKLIIKPEWLTEEDIDRYEEEMCGDLKLKDISPSMKM